MVCGDCGLVLGGRIVDTRSEWRTFSNDDQNNDDPSRVGDGPNLLLNGDQLQTNISFGDGSKAARDLARAQNKSTQDKGNKALMAAYKQIGNLGDNIGLSAVIINHSKHLFKIIHDANAFRGKPQDTLIASCIFVACRQCDSSRTFKDIYKYTGKTKKEVGRMFKLLMKFFQARKETSQSMISLGRTSHWFAANCAYQILKMSPMQPHRPKPRSSAFVTAATFELDLKSPKSRNSWPKR